MQALDALRELVRQYPDGMLPSTPCKGCGKPLNADRGHLAEVYLGTFTGLCYACQNGAAYPEQELSSGATLWNFPPHCPTWRRDREHFIGFAGCPGCASKGRIMISRHDTQGGSYPVSCEACSDRHYKHPATTAEHAHAADSAVVRKWADILSHGFRPADIALDDMVRTGHATRAQVNKWILARRAKQWNQTQPRTGQPCTCRRGQQRDNCPACEGTGYRIDFSRAEVQARLTKEQPK